jgi:hypothetical protein
MLEARIVWWVMERLKRRARVSGKGPGRTGCCAAGAGACVGLNRTCSETDAGPSSHFPGPFVNQA